jgi:hypothetical protein
MLAASGGSHEKGRAIVVLPQFLCHGVVVLGWDEHMGGPLGGTLPHALGPRQPKPGLDHPGAQPDRLRPSKTLTRIRQPSCGYRRGYYGPGVGAAVGFRHPWWRGAEYSMNFFGRCHERSMTVKGGRPLFSCLEREAEHCTPLRVGVRPDMPAMRLDDRPAD